MKKLIKTAIGLIYFHLLKKEKPRVGNRILIYHAFGSRLAHDTYGISISLRRFEEHLRFIQTRWKIIPIRPETYFDSLLEFGVSISIDDGYADTMLAADLMATLKIPFQVGIVSDFIGTKDYLTPKQVQMLSGNPFCTIGSHGKTHKKIGYLPPADQREEIFASKMALEDLLGKSVEVMSYPHGIFSSQTQELAREAGYKIVLSSINGINTQKNLNPFALRRTEVVSSDAVGNLRRKVLGYCDFR